MCGIFGTTSENCVEKTISALRFLEYRGYDSVGICIRDNGLEVFKTAGRISALEKILPDNTSGQSAIGHTRWATHGEVCARNAHPFLSENGIFAVCHNGIIENWLELKNSLSPETRFTSDTDSEVIAHLLQKNFNGDILQSVFKTARMLKGSFAVLIQNAKTSNIYAIKRKSPLIVGIGENGVYLCSDVRCVAQYAKKAAVVPDGTAVEASGNSVRFFTFDGVEFSPQYFVPRQFSVETPIEGDIMFREICQIPERLAEARKSYFQSGGSELSTKLVSSVSRVYFLGCGTAYNSGMQAAAVARNFCHIDMFPVVASEFVYDRYLVDSSTLAFCISQSGETADTVRAAEKVREQGGFVYAVTNTDMSSLCLVADKIKNVCAGGEYAVASTKAYNCQVQTLVLLMSDFAYLRGEMSPEKHAELQNALDAIPRKIDSILSFRERIAQIAHSVKNSSAVFFLGRAADYPTAVEGSLKLKEISYIHSEAYPSGELKHGTLALMEKGVTAVMISTDISLSEKNRASCREIAARGAEVISLSPYITENKHIFLPTTHPLLYGIISVVPLQLLAYYVAKDLGRDVDKPRNLAKSVTVE